MTRPSRDPASTTPSYAHSRLHLYPQTHANANVTANASSSTLSIPTTSIRNLINSEDARLLDPSYLSPAPITSQSGLGRYFASSAERTGNSGGTYTSIIPYIDPQGTLHDPDYRPFPLINHKKQTGPSPFAVRKPYWDSGDEEEFGSTFGTSCEEGETETGRSTPNTPRSTTPFMHYFLKTHPLEHGSPPPEPSGPSCDSRDNDLKGTKTRGKRRGHKPYVPPQLKVNTSCMSIATDHTQGYTHSPTTSAEDFKAGSSVGHSTNAFLSNSLLMGDVSPGKEKRGWVGLLRKKSGRGEKD